MMRVFETAKSAEDYIIQVDVRPILDGEWEGEDARTIRSIAKPFVTPRAD